MKTMYVSVGSNMGDRTSHLQKAIDRLQSYADISIMALSSFYSTPPWGKVDQSDFINAALSLETSHTPESILTILQEIERLGGRTRHERWGPRTIDLDLLYAEEEGVMITSSTESLLLPHPFFWDRAFVLVPLAEIAKNFTFNGQSILHRLEELHIVNIQQLP